MREPATTLTDYALALLAVGFALSLLAQARRMGSAAHGWWGAAFLALALGAGAGGTWHGFGPRLPPVAAAWLWHATTVAIGATALAMALATTRWRCPPRGQRWVMAGWAAFYAFFLAWTWTRDDFLLIIAFYAPALLFTLGAQGLAWLRARTPGTGWIVGGCALSVVAAAIQQSDLAVGGWLNHNDIYHIVQAAALYAWYRGGRMLAKAGDAVAG